MMAKPQVDFMKARALVIGIADYATVAKLPWVDDARDLADVLMNPEYCGYGHVKVLAEHQATKDAILEELNALAQADSSTTTVLIYFSGHGEWIPDGEHKGDQFLLPVDADDSTRAKLRDSAISGQDFTAKLGAIAKRTEQLMVILDCCHSGDLVDLGAFAKDLEVVRPGLSENYLKTIGEMIHFGEAQVVITAAWKTERAYVLSGARHGAFTKHLIEGLKGEAPRSGGMIRIGDLYDYIQQSLEQEQEDDAFVATKLKQVPLFAGRYAKNFPIARHMGGKTGSGTMITGALAVLVRLIDENPDVRAMVGNIKDKLEVARQDIKAVNDLKLLHDGLYELQARLFDRIVAEMRHFPEEEEACQNLANWAKQVRSSAKRLWPTAKMVSGERNGAKWLKDLVRAAKSLRKGAKAHDPVKVRVGIWGLRHVLSTRPFEVNIDLLHGIDKMDLIDLFRELMRIGDEMGRRNVAADDIRTFTAGGLDLGRLGSEIDDLMKQHDRWQDIDKQMRLIENSGMGHAPELDAAWPTLNKAIQQQLDGVALSHQDDLREAVDGVLEVMAQVGSASKYGAFRHLREVAVGWFETLDKTLLARCNELNAIDARLNWTIAAVEKPTFVGESIS